MRRRGNTRREAVIAALSKAVMGVEKYSDVAKAWAAGLTMNKNIIQLRFVIS
jgi:hypothetical protein